MLAPYLILGARAEEPPQTVVVLGAARGGTSMVAGILRIMGVVMGEDVDADNNEDRVFQAHRGDRQLFTDKANDERKRAYFAQIRAHIAARSQAGSVWGWKDPLASYYIRDVASLLIKPAYIAVTRDPTAVAIREQFFEKPQRPGALAAYVLNATNDYIRIVQFLAAIKQDVLLISYERALRQPHEIVSAIRALLRLPEDPAIDDRAIRFIVPDRGTGRIA